MYTELAEKIEKPTIRAIVYAQAGIGKTTVAKILAEQGKSVLVVDVDRSTSVLRGVKGITIIYLADDLVNRIVDEKGKLTKEVKNQKECGLVECVEYIEKEGSKYDVIFFDNYSQAEKNMLTFFGNIGNNDGVPNQGDYQRMQFKMYDYLKRIMFSHPCVIITTWEIIGNSVDVATGNAQLRKEPMINAKVINYLLGLANIVAHYELGLDADGNTVRGFRLEGNGAVFAKDQVYGRKGCKLNELLGEVVEKKPK